MNTASLWAGVTAASCLALSPAFAAVTPYSWIRSGETGNVFLDSSGTGHNFNAAFSSGCVAGAGGGGNPAAVIVQTGVGGPLGTTAAISTSSTRWGSFTCGFSGMWIQGQNNSVPPPEQWSLPAVNWVMEAWVLPQGTGGSAGHATSQIVSTGSGQFGGRPGGACFRTEFAGEGSITIRAHSIGPQAADNFVIGDPVTADTTHWIHLAVVNDNGATTFYVNGVANGAPSTSVTAPSGVPYIGSGQDTSNPFDGYIDEVRYSTFAAGQFAATDLLLRPSGPSILVQPQPATVWEGGAAPFTVQAALDPDLLYQWKRNGSDLGGENGPELFLPTVAAGDSGAVFTVELSSGGVDVLSSSAALTVLPKQTANAAFYRESVQAESGLVAYFPTDGDSGTIVVNVKDGAHDGVLSSISGFDGQTNRAFGERALRFRGDNDVTIPNSADYEFVSGSGTVEALVYLAQPAGSGNGTIFSMASAPVSYYQIQASLDGSAISYRDDSGAPPITWPAPTSLLGRFAHLAIVFTPGNITAYLDGQSLGTKARAGFGFTAGQPANIGSSGRDLNSVVIEPWRGTIDEVAIYNTSLSANAIAIHNSRFIYGTAVTGPSVQSQPTGTKSLLAGGAPVFSVKAGGTAPLSYQWKRNGAAITGNDTATTPNLVLDHSTVGMSGDYTVTISNPIGDVTSEPFTVNFVAAPDSYAASVLADNPSAYWRLNEGSGTVCKDYAGGIDGAYATSVELGKAGAPGVTDQAAHFAGSGSPVPNAIVPYNPTLNPSTEFTLEFWVKPDQNGQISRCVIGNQNRNTGRAGYAVYQGFNVNGWEAHLGFGDTVLFIQGLTAPVAGQWYHIAVTWNGVDTSRIYVNGTDDTNPGSTVGGPHRPNLSVPLEIGSRFGSGIPYPGTIDEVAFYNHALTPEQIRQHWSVSWVPSSITQQPPATLNATEPQTVTITAVAAGYPNTYQWTKDGVALTTANNPDGTAHYPSGVNAATLVIAQSTPADSGVYQLEVTNPLGDSISSETTLTVAPDTTPPTISYVSADSSLYRVRVKFSRWVTAATASIAANYTFSGGVTANSVVLTTDPSVVDVVTTGLTPGASYTLSVTGVTDQRTLNNVIGPNSTPVNAYVLTASVLAWDYYGRIAGTAVDSLVGDPQFPDGVYTNGILTNFSTMPLTAGDLNSNPGFGPMNLGSDYGIRIYGWITPTVSGNYTFFLRSDDASQLWLSPNAEAAGKAMIAFETGCCDPYKEPGAEETSTPQALIAGERYYVEVLNKEGGGGDYAEVAWRLEGDPTPAATLTPIPGQFLSAYAPRPEFSPITRNGAQLTISWTGAGTLQESTDLKTWAPVAGNPPSGYNVTPAPNTAKFYRIQR